MFRILKNRRNFLTAAIFLMLFFAFGGKAVTVGDAIKFNVNKNFDSSARSDVQAVLIKTTPSLYFYIEKSWWDAQVPVKQNDILTALDNLSTEFDGKIYPTLTSIFGSDWRPGVDGDNKITILFQSMKEDAGGYFQSADEYIKLQAPESNEREMMYLSLGIVDNPSTLKIILAHELVHLITFNQKDRLQGVSDEVWLNEARADYSSTILGYDNAYDGSNLQKRVKDFLQNPSDSLTEWQETKYDYAVTSVFMHYLVDHYSVSVLSDSLRKKSIGIASLNEVLLQNGAKENFSQIFTDWTVAIVLNDCSGDLKYCYLNQNLKDLRMRPTLNFLPVTGNSSLSVSNITKNWSGNWQKIIGGNGDLTLDFSSLAGLNFQIPYIIFDKDNNYSIHFLQLDKNEKGQIVLNGFGTKYSSLVIIPSLETKIGGFDGLELTYPYTFTVSVKGDIIPTATPTPTSTPIPTPTPTTSACVIISNLYFGLSNNSNVRCLQQFLKNQGTEIYPEGLVTGNFFTLTKAAVVRFQKKYGIYQTGFVGPLTRAKISQLLGS